MTDFFSHLIEQHMGQPAGIEPLIPSLFEPAPFAEATLPVENPIIAPSHTPPDQEAALMPEVGARFTAPLIAPSELPIAPVAPADLAAAPAPHVPTRAEAPEVGARFTAPVAPPITPATPSITPVAPPSAPVRPAPAPVFSLLAPAADLVSQEISRHMLPTPLLHTIAYPSESRRPQRAHQQSEYASPSLQITPTNTQAPDESELPTSEPKRIEMPDTPSTEGDRREQPSIDSAPSHAAKRPQRGEPAYTTSETIQPAIQVNDSEALPGDVTDIQRPSDQHYPAERADSAKFVQRPPDQLYPAKRSNSVTTAHSTPVPLDIPANQTTSAHVPEADAPAKSASVVKPDLPSQMPEQTRGAVEIERPRPPATSVQPVERPVVRDQHIITPVSQEPDAIFTDTQPRQVQPDLREMPLPVNRIVPAEEHRQQAGVGEPAQQYLSSPGVAGERKAQSPVRKQVTARIEDDPSSDELSVERAPAEQIPAVRVHIGRIDVRAVPPAPAQASRRSEIARPALSLSEYMQQRKRGTR